MKRRKPTGFAWKTIVELLSSTDLESVQLGISIMETYKISRKIRIAAYKIYNHRLGKLGNPDLIFTCINQIKNYIR